MSGKRRKGKSFFLKGHGTEPRSMPYVEVQDKPLVRLDEEEFRKIVHTTLEKELNATMALAL